MSSGSDMIILSFNKNKWEWNGYFPVLNPSHKCAIWKKSKKKIKGTKSTDSYVMKIIPTNQ